MAIVARARSLARGQLVLDTAGTAGLNVALVVLNFALVLLLSRLLGADGFGAYASAFAWASVLSVIAVLGLPALVIRHTAEYASAGALGLLHGLLRRTNQAVLLASTATVVVAAAIGWLIYEDTHELLYPFWVALALVPLIALTSLRQAAMQGLGRVVLGRVPETIVAPALAIVLVGIVVLASDWLSPARAIGLQVAATLAAFALGAWLLRRTLPTGTSAARPEYDMRSWRRSGLALVSLNGVMAANAQLGTILLAALVTAADAGIFNVAVRASTLISFVMLAATYPLMPAVARLYAGGEVADIQRTVIRAGRGVLAFAVPVTLVLIVFAPWILGLFGPEFEDGATALRILALGELAKVVLGFGGLVLVMTGHEADLARSVFVGAILNLGLTTALIPSLGVEGAALAAVVGLVVSNLLMAALARRRLGVWAPVLGSRNPLPAQQEGE
jgi:O-antigen/teichoic acid export membrane protein